MTEKYTGKLHHMKEAAKTRWDDMKEQGGAKEAVTRKVEVVRSSFIRKVNAGEGYDHHYRRKSRRELVTISAAVMGIEFAYAAETAFVSPTLLKIGEYIIIIMIITIIIIIIIIMVMYRSVAVSHDSDLVFVSAGGILPHSDPGQLVRQVQVTPGPEETLHHPSLHRSGPGTAAGAQWQGSG